MSPLEYNQKDKLKFSIITVCLNSEPFIEMTIKSVIDQNYPDIEYIVIDGKSDDNTMNIIEKYKGSIDIIISEKDDGIYPAMNKGLSLTSGDIIYFLNSGDYLFDKQTISYINDAFIKEPLTEIVYGDIIEYDDLEAYYIQNFRKNSFQILTRCGIAHQSIFAKKELFNPNNIFDTKYRIYADYNWLLNSVIKLKKKIKYINKPVAYYRLGGQSQQINISKYYIERIVIINKYIKYFNFRDLFFEDFEESINLFRVYSYFVFYYIASLVKFW
jgi:glycosyltransferase involved in cell wall biosynthesis